MLKNWSILPHYEEMQKFSLREDEGSSLHDKSWCPFKCYHFSHRTCQEIVICHFFLNGPRAKQHPMWQLLCSCHLWKKFLTHSVLIMNSSIRSTAVFSWPKASQWRMTFWFFYWQKWFCPCQNIGQSMIWFLRLKASNFMESFPPLEASLRVTMTKKVGKSSHKALIIHLFPSWHENHKKLPMIKKEKRRLVFPSQLHTGPQNVQFYPLYEMRVKRL